MSKYALYIKLEARPEKRLELERFLKQTLPAVKQEDDTKTWYAFRQAENAYVIFDTFSSEAGRDAHLQGNAVQTLHQVADELLIRKPEFVPVDLLAQKVGLESEVLGDPEVKKYGLRFIDGL
ncbi:antibiotic biosynthesis monooxygenase [Methylobacillus gramineus]|uniref:putative quinol monooxygenase n=1 Tax=Methylobacillus gramineus TaxID=755169 RepID=UPI001CFF6A0E|nr:antibiotic biosynthesis monooxygenase [Methylobacillus gramineus]MCB5184267.1 antibiotic biosynthesis monooxygenase [Methylobacillus gramineus]